MEPRRPVKRHHGEGDDSAPEQQSLCFQFQRGECTRGATCKFAHEPAKFCVDFANGDCARGDKCKFSHGAPPVPAEKPNFGLSGALAKDSRTGNVRKGKQSKWAEPADAKVPMDMWRLYVFKDDQLEDTLFLHRQSAFLFGRDAEVADIVVNDASVSKQHAVLQMRLPVGSGLASAKPYIIDLESTNGTRINGDEVKTSHYVELKDGDVLTFGQCTVDYVVQLASKA